MEPPKESLDVITIDGPAGAGKGTVSRIVARLLSLAQWDSGSIYRALTHTYVVYGEIVYGLVTIDPAGVRIDGVLATKAELRSPEVNGLVSDISTQPEVRQFVHGLLRDAAARYPNSVTEGRDMGTHVFPDAVLKIFLTASPEARALRCLKDEQRSNAGRTLQDVLEENGRRDHKDSTREINPLVPAEDAHVIDCTEMTAEQVAERIVELWQEIMLSR